MARPAVDRAAEHLLIARAQGGDQQATAQILDQHRLALWRIVNRISSRGETRDDLFQWAVVYFLQCLASFDPSRSSNFLAWYYNLVQNSVRHQAWSSGVIHLPRHARKTDAEACGAAFGIGPITYKNARYVEPAAGPAPDRLEHSELLQTLSAAIDRLPPELKEIIQLRLAGCTQPEIGLLKNLTKQRIQQLERRATALLASLMGESCPTTNSPS
jgi:RNA polymerase sigma factor (sigma-70 family)